METTLKDRGFLSGQGTKHQITVMAGNSGSGEMGDLFIGKGGGHLHRPDEFAQTGTQLDQYLRRFRDTTAEKGHRRFDLLLMQSNINHLQPSMGRVLFIARRSRK